MKKLVLTLAAGLAAVSSFAQGTINFQNVSGTGQPGGPAFITNGLTGARIPSGSTFLIQLYYGAAGAAEGSLVAVTNPASSFSSAGIFSGGTRILDAAIVGSCLPDGVTPTAVQATLQVRAWLAVSAGSPDVLRFENATTVGKSGMFTVTAGNPCAMPPGTPANMNGLRGFAIAPEPSTIGLGAIGLAALALLRRRK